MENLKVEKYLKQLYMDDPSGSQPTALWKIFDMYKDVQFEVNFIKDGISDIQVKADDTLITYYSLTNLVTVNELKKFKLALINSKYLINDESFTCDKYFKKVYRYKDNFRQYKNDVLEVVTVNIKDDLVEISNFINVCYTDINVSIDEVLSWSKRDVYNKDLWVWLINKRTNEKVALGIAEVDSTIGEGVLEWIQVSPKHHHKGYAKVLVSELQFRMKSNVEFITVAGRLDDVHNPAKLYESCGFTDNNVWMIIRN